MYCRPLVNPYPDQREAFRTVEAETGINPGFMIAVANLESNFGRTDESFEDGDPFNHQTYWSGRGLLWQTSEIIKVWPEYWYDQVYNGNKAHPIIGLKGSGIAQGYNPDFAWGPKVAGKYYKMDLYLGFKERDRINAMEDPYSDGTLILIEQ